MEQQGEKNDWETKYEASVAIFAALAHPIRISIAHCLVNKPHTVSELTEHLEVSQPLVSHHLKILREAHVITREVQGRTSLYELTDHHISHIVTDVHEHTKEMQ
ncbi:MULTISPECIES: helix-turn-helix transcriptional regulator [unclassified Rothia (in: high G+C Gram-positive bacteria)]|uniref:ArsR/SmtB family transcription factor n=1 Tax=unclassified Rothia (in: high G+C Gram-positive bacteria) TaxID=2689056 RepID=UPI001958B748|nr:MULTISPECIES: metalloregulator ArsR/SmtB family transcription factor [unclassified Rothia (in: high G+C Gram-positive bacteria)]MBM7050458.1 winged helix-turn-helix transcriptional regulator [Rothia sp. ZJ1223]QRZ62439.1 winged helix-turn-helix transcriptional regulator [Rothia sp. ZJ932]